MIVVHMSNGKTTSFCDRIGETFTIFETRDALEIKTKHDGSHYVFRWSAVDYFEAFSAEVTHE